MNSTNKLSNNNNPTNRIIYPHVIFSFERKDYTIAELLTNFSADFLDLIYLHNVFLPESPCAAIRVSVPTLNIFVNCYPPPLLTIKFFIAIIPPLWAVTIASSSQQSSTNPSAPPSQNRLVAHTAKQLNNQHPNSHHLNSLRKNHKHKKPRNTHTHSLLLPNLQIDLVLLYTPPPLYPTIGNPICPHQNQTQIHQTQAQQQQQITAQILLPYSGFLPNTTLPTHN